jgi:hypothetical protein
VSRLELADGTSERADLLIRSDGVASIRGFETNLCGIPSEGARRALCMESGSDPPGNRNSRSRGFHWPPTCSYRTVKSIRYLACSGLIFCGGVSADPVAVRHTQGYIHGFLVLKDTNDKILASGDLIQFPSGSRVTDTLSLHFADGSLYEETSVFSQSHNYRLLTYKQVMKGAAFKTQETLSLNTSTGAVHILSTEKDGKEKTIDAKLFPPPDLANGILSMLLTEAAPQTEMTLSMLVSTPKPRIVKLKISPSGQESFSVGGFGAKATHYIMKIDIGGVEGVAAKVVGKQPPSEDFWIAAGNAPIFLKSEGPLYEDGPIWRIELASPIWPNAHVRNQSAKP